MEPQSEMGLEYKYTISRIGLMLAIVKRRREYSFHRER
jgi:hypothetical protein